MNSLPTPFARFFVVQEAFRRLTEEKRNSTVHAGLAYARLVSDCLDVFEILFNKKYHENQWGDNVKVVVKVAEYDSEMNFKIKKSFKGSLVKILKDVEEGRLEITSEYEDIHSFVEAVLIDRIGDAGKKMHTGRSRMRG